MYKTKIVCTIGPASSGSTMVEKLVKSGMNVARMNFSHGSHKEHISTFAVIRRVSERLGAWVSVLQDLQGPKIRTGPVENGGYVRLMSGEEITLTTSGVPSTPRTVSVDYPGLPRDVSPGDFILLSDGLIRLEVMQVNGDNVRCGIVQGGMLGEHKGVNLPGIHIDLPSLTEKDKVDLELGLSLGVDYVGLSFVRDPADIVAAKDLIESKGHHTPVIAKLEKPEALAKLDAILTVADGVMVARGDLGVELPQENVPTWQKRIIAMANKSRVPVITATQMLESMVVSPTPTRAEVSDVANAIIDGSDAVMLSAETAIGAFPVEAVQMIARIAEQAESHLNEVCAPMSMHLEVMDHAQAICQAAWNIAQASEDVVAIAAFTESGYTAFMLSKERPRTPILAFTPFESTCRRLVIYWGVTPILCDYVESVEGMVSHVEEALVEGGLVTPGKSVVLVASLPIGEHGTTNFLKLHKIGD